MQQQLGTGTAVASCPVVIQLNLQVFTQGIQPMVRQIRIAPPPHLAGAGVSGKLLPKDPVGIQAFGQHAHIERGVMGNQDSPLQHALQAWPQV